MSSLISDIVLLLNDGVKIKLTEGLRGPYRQLVNSGYANYDGKFVTKNWKTILWNRWFGEKNEKSNSK